MDVDLQTAVLLSTSVKKACMSMENQPCTSVVLAVSELMLSALEVVHLLHYNRGVPPNYLRRHRFPRMALPTLYEIFLKPTPVSREQN